ncbi:hypothetical protein GTA08_BOTSDO09615 [Neofusicoccum parvum]|nr:hypothetical protein GTA08_BOTSDO09615 [Neofusicoccum parvum]
MSTPHPQFTTPSSRWRALLTRNPAAHASFVYAVLTTRIYCRPTCAARLARRANVTFYDDAARAAAAGFRACKRCGPDGETDGEREAGRRAARRAKEVLEREGGRVVWREVAREVGRAPRYLHEVFKAVVGVTPGVYAEGLRRGRGAEGKGEGGVVVEESGLGGVVGEMVARDGLVGGDAGLFDVGTGDAGVAEGLGQLCEDAEWNWENLVLWEAVTFPLQPGEVV